MSRRRMLPGLIALAGALVACTLVVVLARLPAWCGQVLAILWIELGAAWGVLALSGYTWLSQRFLDATAAAERDSKHRFGPVVTRQGYALVQCTRCGAEVRQLDRGMVDGAALVEPCGVLEGELVGADVAEPLGPRRLPRPISGAKPLLGAVERRLDRRQ